MSYDTALFMYPPDIHTSNNYWHHYNIHHSPHHISCVHAKLRLTLSEPPPCIPYSAQQYEQLRQHAEQIFFPMLTAQRPKEKTLALIMMQKREIAA
jgi:hypothetical protein